MSLLRRKITTAGNSAALILSQDLLGLMGVAVGEEVELSLIDRTLVVRPVVEQEVETKIAAAIDGVFRDHGGLLKRLGKGPGRADINAHRSRKAKTRR